MLYHEDDKCATANACSRVVGHVGINPAHEDLDEVPIANVLKLPSLPETRQRYRPLPCPSFVITRRGPQIVDHRKREAWGMVYSFSCTTTAAIPKMLWDTRAAWNLILA